VTTSHSFENILPLPEQKMMRGLRLFEQYIPDILTCFSFQCIRFQTKLTSTMASKSKVTLRNCSCVCFRGRQPYNLNNATVGVLCSWFIECQRECAGEDWQEHKAKWIDVINTL